jgi:hypothetical protein
VGDPSERFSHQRRVLAEVLRHDRCLARRARVIARVGEARETLEQDLQLEQVLDLVLDG